MPFAIPCLLYFLWEELKKPLILVAPMASKVAAEQLMVCIILDGSCLHFNLVILCHPKEWINVVTALLVELKALVVDQREGCSGCIRVPKASHFEAPSFCKTWRSMMICTQDTLIASNNARPMHVTWKA
jgi:hypothetical protein